MVSESQNVNTSAISPADSSLWIATSARGLVRVGKNGKAFSYAVGKDGLQSNNIVSLSFDSEGVLWVKDDQQNVYSYTSFSGFVKKTDIPQNIAAALSEPVVNESVEVTQTPAPASSKGVPSWVLIPLTVLLLVFVFICILQRRPKPAKPKAKPAAAPKPAVAPAPVAKPESRPEPKPVVGEPEEGSFYEEVYNLVMKNFRNPEFGVEDVAESFGISRVHLNRKLKAENSPSPSDMIKTMRMELAAGMLKDGTHSISEIAQECGFSSASYFSSAFKEYYGVAPAAYVK